MTRRTCRTAALSGLALATALAGGMLTFVGITPASAAQTLNVTGPASPQTVGTGFDVTVSNATASANVILTLTTAPSGSTLTCTSNTESANSIGVATFTDCVIDKPSSGTGDVLGATDSSNDNPGASSPFIVVGTATKLAFTTEPSSSAMGGTAFAVQPVVSIEDAAGNVVTTDTSQVTLSLAGSPTGAALACTSNPRAASAGVATFAGCAINLANSYAITATDGKLTVAVSTNIDVGVGPATRLSFTTEPSGNSALESAFAVQPIVSVEDAGGNVVTSGTNSNALVSLAITGSPAGPSLTCTANNMIASAGVATFAGCAINLTGRFSLTASAPGLSSVVSTEITVGGSTAISIAPSFPPRVATGKNVTFTATVTPMTSNGTLTGTVSYEVNGTAIPDCTNEVLSSGTAKCTLTFEARGRYTITATYAGDPQYNSSSARVFQVVDSEVLPKEIDTVIPEGRVNFRSAFYVRIHLYGARGTVTGRATVVYAGKAICSAALVNGIENCTTNSSSIGHGIHRLIVLYKGQGLYYSHNQAVFIAIS
jgi:hypothetical protein